MSRLSVDEDSLQENNKVYDKKESKLLDKRYIKPKQGLGPTKYLYIAGVGDQLGTNPDILFKVFSKFGPLDPILAVDMIPNRRYCYVIFQSIESAEQAQKYFQANPEVPELGNIKIHVKYADIDDPSRPRGPPEPECTSSTYNVYVPGCQIISNFITEDEESLLLDCIANENGPWKDTISRRVQHYGYTFNYRTLMLDYSKNTPPIPTTCQDIIHKMSQAYHILPKNGTEIDVSISSTSDQTIDYSDLLIDIEAKANVNKSLEPPINQLTINEYFPGQGIASHTGLPVDTETCLGPVLLILNVGGSIVMNLNKNQSHQAEEHESESDDSMGSKKYLFLPRRSLLILTGQSRYNWSHGISPRKYDKVNGQLIPRERRVSFTFRQGLRPGTIPSSLLKSSELELDHVVRVYNNIAVHWNHTRGKRKVYWHRVKDFLDSLSPGTLLADIGSGDGKYFGVNPNIVSIGCDRSIKLLEVSKDPQHETFCCDAVKIPMQSDRFDAVLCIAVMHHISTIDRRYSLISELMRIARPGGLVMVQAWALEQGTDSRRTFESQDTMVPWKLSKRFMQSEEAGIEPVFHQESPKKDEFNISTAQLSHSSELEECKHVQEFENEFVFQRYCHMYKEGELEDICSCIPGCIIKESGWDKGNWFVLLEKDNNDKWEELQNGPESKIPVLPPRKKDP